jgi:uncharacterized SAM-dependent methyltransferase
LPQFVSAYLYYNDEGSRIFDKVFKRPEP